ncbi:MAG: hypothetical protein QG553_173 [Patescibacteria group bacterium]|nr:hypothetical protein [Patescibacteria group bacterium]
MATYRVLQDIEAEDKLIGPLSLRQFIYAIIVAVLGYVSFRLFTVQPFLIIPLVFPMLLFGILAAPFGHDQSSEIWLLAKIRFFLKPRTRIWDQTGIRELVTVTAPKKVEQIRTDNLDETQVRSRLQALAQTIDTRGWVIKGVDVNLYSNPTYIDQASDRLITPGSLQGMPVSDVNVNSNDDILDTRNNPVAAQMAQLVQANDEAHRNAVLNHMQKIRTMQDQTAVAPPSTPVTPVQTATTMPPTTVPTMPPAAPQQQVPTTPMKPAPNPAILELAHNDDLSVATIARQANKAELSDNDEVVISLR